MQIIECMGTVPCPEWSLSLHQIVSCQTPTAALSPFPSPVCQSKDLSSDILLNVNRPLTTVNQKYVTLKHSSRYLFTLNEARFPQIVELERNCINANEEKHVRINDTFTF